MDQQGLEIAFEIAVVDTSLRFFFRASFLGIHSLRHFECRFSARWLGIVPGICSMCNRRQVGVLLNNHSAQLTVQKLSTRGLIKREFKVNNYLLFARDYVRLGSLLSPGRRGKGGW